MSASQDIACEWKPRRDLRTLRRRDRGGALIVSLIMLVAVLLLAISAAHIALHGERASRSDRDRQIAFLAAEAALLDAELDIENSADPSRSRSHIFSKEISVGFPGPDDSLCHTGEANLYLGLCRRPLAGESPAWQSVDFGNAHPITISAVPYGRFTGQRFEFAKGSLPAKQPRYIIEQLTYNKEGESAGKTRYFYRITAVGYGARDTTQVALQAYYVKESM